MGVWLQPRQTIRYECNISNSQFLDKNIRSVRESREWLHDRGHLIYYYLLYAWMYIAGQNNRMYCVYFFLSSRANQGIKWFRLGHPVGLLQVYPTLKPNRQKYYRLNH